MPRHERGFFRSFLLQGLLAACALAIAPTAAAQAEPRGIAAGRAAERKNFTDAEIIDGFFQTTLGAEFHVAGRVDRIRRYDTPVRVFIDDKGKSARRAQVETILGDIGRKIQHLDIAVTNDRAAANVTVTLVRERDFYSTLASMFGRERAREIRRSLDPQCLSGFRKDDSSRILGSSVIVAVDVTDFVFADCAYEELLQALGPINDTDKVPWTMFNDTVQKGFFDIYDQYILNILYDPRIRPGMTADDLKGVLPLVLPDVRNWVAKTNGLAR